MALHGFSDVSFSDVGDYSPPNADSAAYNFVPMGINAGFDVAKSQYGDSSSEYKVISLTSSSAASSPYCDLLSGLQDAVGIEVTKSVHSLLTATNPNHLRSVAAVLAKVIANNIQPVNYHYVHKDHRGKAVLAVKTIAPTAPIANVLLAARLHTVSTVKELVSGWKDGRKADISMLNGGFPVADTVGVIDEIIADFEAVKGATAIAGKANPISQQNLDGIRQNFVAIKKLNSVAKVKGYAEFSKFAHASVGENAVAFAKHLYQIPAGVKDVYEGNVKNEYVADCHRWRTIAREALKNGRESRGVDNPSPLTTPWYRFSGAMKSVNRLAYLLAVTRGKIATTTSAQVSQAFSVDPQGWHVYMDNDVPFDSLYAKLDSLGHVEASGRLKEGVIVQVNVLGADNHHPFDKTFKFLAANTVSFGWAIHDGMFFVTRDSGRPNICIPKMLAQVAAVNYLRTLHAHVPFIDLHDEKTLNIWYGVVDDKVNIPTGTFTGHSFDVDLYVGDENERKRAPPEKN